MYAIRVLIFPRATHSDLVGVRNLVQALKKELKVAKARDLALLKVV